jgi:manganese transport protein
MRMEAVMDQVRPPPPGQASAEPSLGALNASVPVRAGGFWLWRLFAFLGPGYMVSVGYMDPGNWATDIAGGAQFGYTLLSVILLSNLMAIVLQALAARLGIATGLDLAQACRERTSRPVSIALWLICEAAIIACDLAEVIGTAIALKLLFGIPLTLGAIITALDVFVVLLLLRRGFRALEAFVIGLLTIIFVCFGIQIALAAPPVQAVLGGFVPSREIVTNPAALYIAIGIIGATVMPHNLYLHSSIVQTRAYPRTEEGRREALRFAVTDSTVALMLALFVNAAILIMAAAVFHAGGRTEVEEIEQAYELLSPLLGVGLASTLFAVALLASGLNSTVTATLAGQIVGAAAHHAGHRHRAGGDRDRALRRAGHRPPPRAEPGGALDAAALRGDPAGPLRLRPAADGPLRDPRLAEGAGLDHRRHHRGAEREAADRHALRRMRRRLTPRGRADARRTPARRAAGPRDRAGRA